MPTLLLTGNLFRSTAEAAKASVGRLHESPLEGYPLAAKQILLRCDSYGQVLRMLS